MQNSLGQQAVLRCYHSPPSRTKPCPHSEDTGHYPPGWCQVSFGILPGSCSVLGEVSSQRLQNDLAQVETARPYPAFNWPSGIAVAGFWQGGFTISWESWQQAALLFPSALRRAVDFRQFLEAW